MTRPSPPWLAELAEDVREDAVMLLGAESVQELQRLLLLTWGPRRTACDDAELLLRVHHSHDAPGALDTVRLMLTDRRWERLTDQLLRAVLRTAVLDDGALDALALELVDEQRLRHECDEDPFVGGTVVVLQTTDEAQSGSPEPAADNDPLVASRAVPPLLRRWAGARTTRRRLLSVEELLECADALAARDAAEAIRGSVEELDALAPEAAAQLLELALEWPAGRVRRAALEQLIARGEHERAVRLAVSDRDETVRRGLVPPSTGADQQSLF